MRNAVFLAATALAASLGAATPAAAQDAYQCSGIGVEEREAASTVPHTLRIEFAQRDGHYLGGVEARISRGGTEVVAVTCPGPWLLAILPDGSYRVSASFEGQTRTADVTIRDGKRQRLVMAF